jgi:hypothetical protein
MAHTYTIVKSDGTVLTNIADGTVNTNSTSVKLPGRNYAGYGEILDTNFVHLIENFATMGVPQNPLRGQLWYNTTTQALYVCPSDGETNADNWFKILTSLNDNTSIGNLTLTGNLITSNALVNETLDANILTSISVTTDTLVSTLGANLLGTTQVTELVTSSISPQMATGNLHGSWTVGTDLILPNGTLEVSGNVDATNFNAVSGVFNGNGSSLNNINSANLTGTIATSVQENITKLGTLETLSVSGNINASWVNANVSANTLTGSLTVASQPNITSFGTLTGLTSEGVVNLSGASNVTLGSITKLRITGGTAGYMLSTNGSGSLSWTNPAEAGLSGIDTQIQFNDNGIFGSSSSLTFNKTSSVLTVTGNINTSNANLGNTTTSNYFSGNGYYLSSISGANVTGSVALASTANALAASTILGINQGGTGANTAPVARTNLGLGSMAVQNSGNVNITGGTITNTNISGLVPTGAILLWSGSTSNIPLGWYLCNGANGTPDLRDRFVLGAGGAYIVGSSGGSPNSVLPTHSHTFNGSTSSNGDHSHTVYDPGHNHTWQYGLEQDDNSRGGSYNEFTQIPGSNTTVIKSNITGIAINSAGTHAHTYSGSTSAAGSNGAGANMPPYYALCYIMKA